MRSSAQQAVLVQNIQLMVKRQCQRTKRSRRWQKYSIVRLETQDIDTDELKFFHALLIKSADELARQAGEGNDSRSGGEFNKMTPFVKEETAKELQNHAVNAGHVSRCS